MKPYQQRVIDEKAELDAKRDRLAAFLKDVPISVPAAEIERL